MSRIIVPHISSSRKTAVAALLFGCIMPLTSFADEANIRDLQRRLAAESSVARERGDVMTVPDEAYLRRAIESASIRVISTSVANFRPRQGELVTISVNVRNSGSEPVAFVAGTLFFGPGKAGDNVQSAIAGRRTDFPILSTETVRIEPGATESLQFRFRVGSVQVEQAYMWNVAVFNNGTFNAPEFYQLVGSTIYIRD